MKKIKVGIPLVKNSDWLGGYNYIINLFKRWNIKGLF